MTTITKIKTKGQMTLPTAVRKLAGIKIGDYVKIQIERGKITVTPQSLIDRELALSLEDVKHRRTSGPFNTAGEAIAFLHKETKRRNKK